MHPPQRSPTRPPAGSKFQCGLPPKDANKDEAANGAHDSWHSDDPPEKTVCQKPQHMVTILGCSDLAAMG